MLLRYFQRTLEVSIYWYTIYIYAFIVSSIDTHPQTLYGWGLRDAFTQKYIVQASIKSVHRHQLFNFEVIIPPLPPPTLHVCVISTFKRKRPTGCRCSAVFAHYHHCLLSVVDAMQRSQAHLKIFISMYFHLSKYNSISVSQSIPFCLWVE